MSFRINFQITDKCNLNCSFCELYNLKIKNKTDYNWNYIKKIILFLNKTKKIKDFDFCIFGGEPTLYPKLSVLLKDIYEFKIKYNLKITIDIQTNLFKIKDIINNIKFIDTISISIHLFDLIKSKNIFNFIHNIIKLNNNNIKINYIYIEIDPEIKALSNSKIIQYFRILEKILKLSKTSIKEAHSIYFKHDKIIDLYFEDNEIQKLLNDFIQKYQINYKYKELSPYTESKNIILNQNEINKGIYSKDLYCDALYKEILITTNGYILPCVPTFLEFFYNKNQNIKYYPIEEYQKYLKEYCYKTPYKCPLKYCNVTTPKYYKEYDYEKNKFKYSRCFYLL